VAVKLFPLLLLSRRRLLPSPYRRRLYLLASELRLYLPLYSPLYYHFLNGSFGTSFFWTRHVAMSRSALALLPKTLTPPLRPQNPSGYFQLCFTTIVDVISFEITDFYPFMSTNRPITNPLHPALESFQFVLLSRGPRIFKYQSLFLVRSHPSIHHRHLGPIQE